MKQRIFISYDFLGVIQLIGKHIQFEDVSGTVDGSEILRSPVEGKVVYPSVCRVLAPFQVVVWDF